MTGQQLAEAEMLPVRGIEAWMGETPDHVNAQVTQLLYIGLLLRGDSALAEEAQALARSVGAPQPRKAGPTAQSLSVDRLRFLVFEPQQSRRISTSLATPLTVQIRLIRSVQPSNSSSSDSDPC